MLTSEHSDVSLWFAWYPVRIEGDIVWWTWVRRITERFKGITVVTYYPL